jgi:hypothetical protein
MEKKTAISRGMMPCAPSPPVTSSAPNCRWKALLPYKSLPPPSASQNKMRACSIQDISGMNLPEPAPFNNK